MATYYWTKQTNGGTGNWSNVNMWASTTGGVGGTGAVPTSADNAIFDANSFNAGSQIVTLNVDGSCNNMDWTNATNNPTYSNTAHQLSIYGNLTTISGMTWSSSYSLYFYGVTVTWTTGGISYGSDSIYLNTPNTGSVTLVGNVAGCYSLVVVNPPGAGTNTFNTGGYNITCSYEFSLQTYTIVNLGASIITPTYWFNNGGTVNGGTSTINCSGNFYDYSGGTYNIVNITGPTCTITGNNTFAQFNLVPGTTQTITFTDGSTQTATSLYLSGSAGHVHTLQGSSTGGWNITYTGGGTVIMDYVAVTYSTASPDNTFYDYTHGTDNLHNIHWYFAAPGGGVLSVIPLGFIHGR